MACQHILVFHDTCGHRVADIEHDVDCRTDNPAYFEKFPTDKGNFMLPDDYEFEHPPRRPCHQPICKTVIAFDNCRSCEIINTHTDGPHPHRLPDAEIAERRHIYDRTQGARNELALERRKLWRTERYLAAYASFVEASGDNCFLVEGDDDISGSQEDYLAVIDQATLGAADGECPVCNNLITEPGGFAPEGAPERATEVRQTPCLHYFHLDCINDWLNQHHNCPLCRQKWLWYTAPLPDYEDPVFEQCVVAPTIARQVSGYLPFFDPLKEIPFWSLHLNLERAQALFGMQKCTVRDQGEQIGARDVRLVRELLAAGLGDTIAPWFENVVMNAPENLLNE